MATTETADPYSDLPKKPYNIVDNGDFTVRVIHQEVRERPKGDGSGKMVRLFPSPSRISDIGTFTTILTCHVVQIRETVPKEVHEFKVLRATVASSSKFFKTLVDPVTPYRAAPDHTDLIGDSVKAVCIWLSILHNVKDMETTYNCSLTIVWEVLEIARKYTLDAQAPGAKAWFAGWYQSYIKEPRGDDDHRSLLFPCHTFDHAQGWAATTKYLAYNFKGHITEKKPPGYHHDHLRLTQHIIGALNGAKGRLRTILHRELYSPIAAIVEAGATPRRLMSLYAYNSALHDTGAWPVEKEGQHNSINALITKLGKFQTPTKLDLGPLGLCGDCEPKFAINDYSTTVTNATSITRRYFDGLCLDCMTNSNPKFGDFDEDYWRHAERGVKWDYNCRISHDQPTWYFSFMGRPEKRIEWSNKQKRQRARGYGYSSDDEF